MTRFCSGRGSPRGAGLSIHSRSRATVIAGPPSLAASLSKCWAHGRGRGKARVGRLEVLDKLVRAVERSGAGVGNTVGSLETTQHPLVKLASLVLEERTRRGALDSRKMRRALLEALACEKVVE